MIEVNDKSKCTGCSTCKNLCPQKCISMKIDSEGFWYPSVNKRFCINCDLCVKNCPVISDNMHAVLQKAYSAYSNNEAIRMGSSSGGVFSALADYILAGDGVVFGAVYNDAFDVEHIVAKDEKSVEKLRLSKYVQSRIGNTFSEAKHCLESGKLVLYTGTPCQIVGLKKYLRKDYLNLYTQDFVCHGVPSPLIWHKHLDYLQKTNQHLKSVNFREKTFGWKNYCVRYTFDGDITKDICIDEDWYTMLYLNKLTIRPSCYNCVFKGKHRASDITLGDFWGINNIVPSMDDDKGTSLLVINTPKGEQLFHRISDKLNFSEVDYNEAIQFNPMVEKSAYQPNIRNAFMKYVTNHDYIESIKLFQSENDESKKIVQLLVEYLEVKEEKGWLIAYLWKKKKIIMNKMTNFRV